MSTYETSAQNTDGRIDPRPAYIHIGEDTEGASHCYDTRRERIHVVKDGERVRVQALDGRPVDHWLQYVADCRGWSTQYLFASSADAWAAALRPFVEAVHGD